MIACHRLCLLTLVVLLAATQTLQAAAPKPDRGLVRFTDDQHIPVRPKAVADPAKPKSSSPTKSKKPSAPAQVDAKKKTPVKPSVAAAAAAVKSEYTCCYYYYNYENNMLIIILLYIIIFAILHYENIRHDNVLRSVPYCQYKHHWF